MPKHNDYPHKMTLAKIKDGERYRYRVWFPKGDAEEIFNAAQGKELVFKITSDPSTLKEKSIGLLLEPLEDPEELLSLRELHSSLMITHPELVEDLTCMICNKLKFHLALNNCYYCGLSVCKDCITPTDKSKNTCNNCFEILNKEKTTGDDNDV